MVGSDHRRTHMINELSESAVKPEIATLKKERVQFVDENSSKSGINNNQQEKPNMNTNKNCEPEQVGDVSINTVRNGNSKVPSCQTKRSKNEPKCTTAPRKLQTVGPLEKRLPAPRKSACVQVTFSPKPALPNHLPARESRGTDDAKSCL